MPNNYFQFKEFTVNQDKCAMKVCTDACLFSAWVADYFKGKSINSILDIGTGTGLLSLLLAQKTTAIIDAVEIDTNAFEQAVENFSKSPWQNRLHVYQEDITIFNTEKKYNLIVSNPPFFEADLKSPQQNKNAAKHDATLTLEVVCKKAKELLEVHGSFAVLLPYSRTNYFIQQALQNGLYCSKKLLVKQTATHSYFRSMLFFTFNKTTVEEKEITIKDNEGNYTPEFTYLLKDYYLYL